MKRVKLLAAILLPVSVVVLAFPLYKKELRRLVRSYWITYEDTIPLEESQKSELVEYLKRRALLPHQYVLEKFKKHQLVFLGEFHRLRQDPLFIQELIPRLYQEAGVKVLGMEFGSVEDQSKADSLVTAKDYKRELAKEIQRHFYDGEWAYEEYMGIYEAAWKLNRSLRKDQPKFRVVLLDPYVNYEKYYRGTPQEKRIEAEKLSRRDQVMAQTIEREILAKGEKALIYSGIYHAFTKYEFPVVQKGRKLTGYKEKMGNIVLRNYPESHPITINLHAPFGDLSGSRIVYSMPFDGAIDQAMAHYRKPAGFDIPGTPFGKLRDPKCFYAYGHPGLRAEDLFDGYVFLMPLSRFVGVTPIADYVDSPEVFEFLRRQLNDNAYRVITGREKYMEYVIRRETDLEWKFHGFLRYYRNVIGDW